MIELGHIPAGNYVESSKAIYWDGRGENRELISSETYFYPNSTGLKDLDSITVRSMLNLASTSIWQGIKRKS